MADVEESARMGMSYVYRAIVGYAKHVSTATPTPSDPDVTCR
jgi:hypothetical protein